MIDTSNLIELRAYLGGSTGGRSRVVTILIWLITIFLFSMAMPLIWYQALPQNSQYGPTNLIIALKVFFKNLIALKLFFGSSPITPSERYHLSVLAPFFINSLSLFAVFWSSLYVFEKAREIRSLSPLRIIHAWPWEVSREQEFSAAWMLKYYKSADFIFVMAGSYDWLVSDTKTAEKMRSKLRELLPNGKLTLLSHRSAAKTFEIWKNYPKSKECLDIFSNIHFNAASDIKGSFIGHNDQVSGFLFLHRPDTNGDKRSIALCHLRSSGPVGTVVRETKALLERAKDASKLKNKKEKSEIINSKEWWT